MCVWDTPGLERARHLVFQSTKNMAHGHPLKQCTCSRWKLETFHQLRRWQCHMDGGHHIHKVSQLRRRQLFNHFLGVALGLPKFVQAPSDSVTESKLPQFYLGESYEADGWMILYICDSCEGGWKQKIKNTYCPMYVLTYLRMRSKCGRSS